MDPVQPVRPLPAPISRIAPVPRLPAVRPRERDSGEPRDRRPGAGRGEARDDRPASGGRRNGRSGSADRGPTPGAAVGDTAVGPGHVDLEA